MALIHYNFNSSVLNQKTDVMIILPDRRWDEADRNRKYQTLYLLHGGGEDYTSYLRYTNIELWANERNLAVVMPNGVNSNYVDMYYGQRYFTYISEELPRVMESVFPLSRNKKDHFVSGFSMGAYGALHWALLRPDFFNACAVMSGGNRFSDSSRYLNPGEMPPKMDLFFLPFGGRKNIEKPENDLGALAEKLKETMPEEQWPRFFSAVGKQDFMYYGSINYARFMQELGFTYEIHTGEGGHDWTFWNTWIPRILDWFALAGDLVEEQR